MTAVAARIGTNRLFGWSYESDAVGEDAEAFRDRAAQSRTGSAITIEQRQAALLWHIISARCESQEAAQRGDVEAVVSPDTVEAAIELLHALPSSLGNPEILADEYGDITFEWYKDRRHVAVLGINRNHIRWSAIFGTRRTMSGSEPFSRTIPAPALTAIQATLD